MSPSWSDAQARRALAALRHRGPDGEGLWRCPTHDVLLGHRRLSIIDLEHGAQPLLNETGDVVAVVNGEFYGYQRIMAGLERLGHRFRTRCDSEILLHLYEEHGLDAVNCLRGEFAFVLWDERRATLVAGRDRFGVKPLFYTVRGGGIRLASEAKALFAAGLRAEWDEEAFHQHLFLMHDGDRSLFAGVRQVPPGHLLLVERGQVTTRRYWDLDYPDARPDDEDSREEVLIAEFREAFEDAVRVRLRADTRVGFFLSGGLDSSAVVGFASRHWDARGRAFTVRFDQDAYDEGEQARETAARADAAFAPIPLTHDALVEAYGDAVAQAETTGHLHGAARYLQCRAVRDAGYKVALTGDGADEVLAGYLHFAGDASDGDRALPAALRPVKDRLGHVPAWVRMLALERSVFHVLLARDYRERQRARRPYVDWLDALGDEPLRGRDPLHQSMYLWARVMLPNYVLAAERLEMAFGVETRPPFLDHRLFDVLRRVPPRWLVRERRGKELLRRAAADVVPAAVLAQHKHPFAAPAHLSRSDSALSRCLDDTFRGRALREMPFFDRDAVLALWTDLPRMPAARRHALEPALLIIYCACVLHERYRLA